MTIKKTGTRASKNSVYGATYMIAISVMWMWLFASGAMDNRSTWTESDMRAEYQLRHERYTQEIASAEFEWERLKAEAKLQELESIWK